MTDAAEHGAVNYGIEVFSEEFFVEVCFRQATETCARSSDDSSRGKSAVERALERLLGLFLLAEICQGHREHIVGLGILRGLFKKSLERFDGRGGLVFRDQGESRLVSSLVLLVLDLDLEGEDKGAEQRQHDDHED